MSCISGIEAFRVRVADGKYNLALLFCGRWPDDVESRSFTVTIEGGKPQEIKNIPAAGAKEPHNAARLFAPNVEVSDGILDIEFTKKDGETVLNGIMLNKVN